MDPLLSGRKQDACCDICKLTEDLLMNKGPLIPVSLDTEKYFLCKKCLLNYVSSNMTTKKEGEIIQYEIKNLVTPIKKIEFPRNFMINNKTLDLITIPKIDTNIYIILERTFYDREPGQIEGMVIKMNKRMQIKVGSGPEADLVFPQKHRVEPHHFTLTFDHTNFYIGDATKSGKTYIKPYSNPKLEDKSTDVTLKIHDHVLKVSWKPNTPATANDFVRIENELLMPNYNRPENLQPDTHIEERSEVIDIVNDPKRQLDHRGNVRSVPVFKSQFIPG